VCRARWVRRPPDYGAGVGTVRRRLALRLRAEVARSVSRSSPGRPLLPSGPPAKGDGGAPGAGEVRISGGWSSPARPHMAQDGRRDGEGERGREPGREMQGGAKRTVQGGKCSAGGLFKYLPPWPHRGSIKNSGRVFEYLMEHLTQFRDPIA